MNVERYFHIRTGDRGGATVRVCGDTEHVGHVKVQVAFCRSNEQFVKKLGRQVALSAPEQIVPLRFLPGSLAMVSEKAMRRAGKWNLLPDYTFALKYFLPKGE